MNPLQAFQAEEEKKFDEETGLTRCNCGGKDQYEGDTRHRRYCNLSLKDFLREHDARLISFLEGYVKPPKNEDESYERNVTETGWDNACLHIEKKFRELRSNEQ